MTENSYVIVVRMFENIGWKRLSWRVSTQLWDKWPKCFSEKKTASTPVGGFSKGRGQWPSQLPALRRPSFFHF